MLCDYSIVKNELGTCILYQRIYQNKIILWNLGIYDFFKKCMNKNTELAEIKRICSSKREKNRVIW
jgi:hypothetical protein